MTASIAHAPLLEARSVSFFRRDEAVFAPLDFAVHCGELALVEGDNGSGKTTLLHVGAGELRWRGMPLQRHECAGEILLLGHHLGLKADLSPYENLRIATGLHGQREGTSIGSALVEAGLSGYEKEPTRRLSAGQKKRAALARLLLVPATLWLLDEPYANLDRAGIALVNHVLKWHIDAGGAALVSSHGTTNFAGDAIRRIHLHG